MRAVHCPPRPPYSRGLTGANSALRRDALERVGAFFPDARVSEDYLLAKRLLQAGTRIRYVCEAPIQTEFPARVGAHLRQQARWLRAAVIFGRGSGDSRKAVENLSTSLVGLAMLALPCLTLALALTLGTASPATRLCGAIWAFAFLHALFSRVRYLKFAGLWLGIRVPWPAFALLPVYLLIDFLAWTIPLFHYPVRSWRENW